jgi:hypothetical protein
MVDSLANRDSAVSARPGGLSAFRIGSESGDVEQEPNPASRGGG